MDLSKVAEKGRAEHPELDVAGPFLEHVERHAGDGSEVRAGDLFLAWACSTGDNRAIDRFFTLFGEDVRRALRGIKAGGIDVDDFVQEFSRRAFGPPSPKIAEYSGKGQLRGWARVVASRVALDLARAKRSSERPVENAGQHAVAESKDIPEKAYLKQHYVKEVRAAIEESARGLDTDDRAALRDHYVRGMTVDDMAAELGVHRATAARRVQRARDALVAGVKRVLDERHGLRGAELESVMNLVQSQMHITMERILG